MKTIIILTIILFSSLITMAQDTVYVSQDKVTALFFDHPVRLVSNPQQAVSIDEKEPGLLTIRAVAPLTHPATIVINNARDNEVYHLPVVYSFGRAGRSMYIHGSKRQDLRRKTATSLNAALASVLLTGGRSDVAGHKREGKIKAWVNKVSIAGNKLYFRLDVRNKSNLPYDIDFIRFYIRDKKTVARVATHEQEVVPLFKTTSLSSGISPHGESAYAFGFPRFPISGDQLFSVEIYERHGNRNLVIELDNGDFDDARPLTPSVNK
ncbi:DUF4138 domain-containing protein [Mucilaginibacter ginkgonis]|uniref:DUF4138 domain-containing protein n=1 Tax=Mucilaginibacter ginkgonis TaxID=2682091 RepID=A0A6I4HV86_9SPHI|nr:DUF4138 domain-containing protein [Mucilaginibacter ginkgonis]QQL49959.1 DUF4138 domain-containing protein [Mucilaginibacter ginkgonis]